MSSSPTFILNPTSGVEEEEMLTIEQGRSHTPPPRSRPNSRLEILIMDMARSTEQKLENLARSQAEQSKSTKEQIEESIREGQDIVIESRLVGPEVNLDLAKKPLHPPVTSFGVAPEVEGSVRGQDVRRSRMARTLTD